MEVGLNAVAKTEISTEWVGIICHDSSILLKNVQWPLSHIIFSCCKENLFSRIFCSNRLQFSRWLVSKISCPTIMYQGGVTQILFFYHSVLEKNIRNKAELWNHTKYFPTENFSFMKCSEIVAYPCNPNESLSFITRFSENINCKINKKVWLEQKITHINLLSLSVSLSATTIIKKLFFLGIIQNYNILLVALRLKITS